MLDHAAALGVNWRRGPENQGEICRMVDMMMIIGCAIALWRGTNLEMCIGAVIGTASASARVISKGERRRGWAHNLLEIFLV